MQKTIKKIQKAGSTAPISDGVGRRKSSIARVWMRRGNGVVTVNGKAVGEYFDTEMSRQAALFPFSVLPASANYDAEARVTGGGKIAQADAVKLAISRAFVAHDEGVRLVLREHNLLTVDARRKERKKFGRKAARRGFQFVKR